MTKATDYYAILGVSQGATPDEIRKAFRAKALQHHPDHGGDEQSFRRLKEAFEYLIENTSAYAPDASFGYRGDPFTDPDYFKHEYFAPENDHLAEFERSIRAQGCRVCSGRGMVSKWVDPSKGFMGREERFCSCQIVN